MFAGIPTGIPTADFESALAWYERFLGRTPDRFPNDHEAVWQLADTGLIYLVVDARRAGNALVTLSVSDLDGWLDEVSTRGINVGEIDTMSGIVRKTAIAQPSAPSSTAL
jgi:catechol 2,3-dioxygenase-like lactoylglutathione lyase family enzyme